MFYNEFNSFQNVNVKVSNAENGESLMSFSTNYPSHLNAARVIDASCKTNKKSDFVCRIVLTTENGAVVQLQSGNKFANCSVLTSENVYNVLNWFGSGKIKWIREESLANIAAVEMIDLPLADNEGVIEKQLKSGSGKFMENSSHQIL